MSLAIDQMLLRAQIRFCSVSFGRLPGLPAEIGREPTSLGARHELKYRHGIATGLLSMLVVKLCQSACPLEWVVT